ncbi:MAG: D-alanyl-D-alanine carboxypeptidase/D-alanyl-D-alanine-endopeptidase [Ferruginibacter sp.]|nr:D-alanyl-D-alanine carboxypeptidase/D-alanyl-D-alanine-endopeptidase [Cytophagales bacterium]
MMSFPAVFLIVRLLCLSSPTHSVPPESPALRKLRTQLETLQNDSLARHGLVAFSVRSVATGVTILELNGHRSAAPASTLKLVTTATALLVLGQDFAFQTSLEYDGELRDGTLQGNLYLRGGGDPTLGSNRFEGHPDAAALTGQWVERVKAAGIRRINGAVVADAGIFEENALPSTWVWGDVGNYYGAAAYGLNFNENLYRVIFQPGPAVGSAARVLRTEPAVPGLEFANRVTTGAPGSGDQCYIYGAPYHNLGQLEGTIPAGAPTFAVRGALPDPPFFLACHLHQQLVAAGFVVRDAPTTDRLLRRGPLPAGKRTLLYTHPSPPLKDIIQQTNFQSINLYAEALLKTLDRYLGPVRPFSAGSTEYGTRAVVEYWRRKGMATQGFWMRDGSGLSPQNAITAAQLTDLLRRVAGEPDFGSFYASVPVVGVSGTVKGLARGTRAAGNVRAKSGSTERVKSYAGYFRDSAGEQMSFALLVNNYDEAGGRVARQMEAILVTMAAL